MNTLKPHPFLPVKDQFARFAGAGIANAPARAVFAVFSSLWRRVNKISCLEAEIARDLSEGRDAFGHNQWLYGPRFVPACSCSFVLKDDGERDPLKKAARLVLAAAEFRQSAENGTLPPEHEAGKPQDMERYRYLFARIRLSRPGKGKSVQTTTVAAAATDFVVVLMRGYFYRLTLPRQPALRATSGILAALRQMESETRALDSSPAAGAEKALIGLLTAVADQTRVQQLARLQEKNQDFFAAVNGGLFLVCVDLDSCPETEDETLRAIHSDNFWHRDHRRSMQIVVTGNGKAGIVVDPHVGIGGTISARFCSELHTSCLAQRSLPESGPDGSLSFERLHCDTTPLKSSGKILDRLRRHADAELYPRHIPTSYRINALGKHSINHQGHGLDGLFHAALHLAYYRRYARVPVVGNFINLRTLRFGDIWRYNATTDAMVDFTRNPTDETLRAATTAHKELIGSMKEGHDPFYLSAMTIMKLYCENKIGQLAIASLMIALNMLIPGFNRRFLFTDLWVSNIPAFPGIEAAGRGATKMDFLAKGNIGGHYMFFDDHIKVCLLGSSKDKNPCYGEAEFVRELEGALSSVMALLQPMPQRAGAVAGLSPERDFVTVESPASRKEPSARL
jgi:hypothetical protein